MITLFRVMNPHQRYLQAKVKIWNEPKQVMPKSEDLSRSLEIKPIWTFDTEFPTIFNKSCTYITFKSAVKHGQLLVLHDIRCRKSQSPNETDIGPGSQSSRSRSTHCCRS